MPGVLSAALAATYLILLLTGWSLIDGQPSWTFRPQPVAGLVSPWQPAALRSFSWTEMPRSPATCSP